VEAKKRESIKRMFAHDLAGKRAGLEATVKAQMDDDLALIAQLEAEKANEVAEDAGKKRRLAQEAATYHQYLVDTRKAEEVYEAECDLFMNEEARKASVIRRAKVQAEQHKRAEMMLDVVRTLQLQMEHKWNAIMQARMEKMNEAKQIATGIAALNKQSEAKDLALKRENKEHQLRLIAQREEVEHERAMIKQADVDLNRTLSDGFKSEEQRINDAIAAIALR
jgi:hypothetical protein